MHSQVIIQEIEKQNKIFLSCPPAGESTFLEAVDFTSCICFLPETCLYVHIQRGNTIVPAFLCIKKVHILH